MIESLIARYGLFALFLGAAFEGETVVVIGGIMVHRDLLPFLPAIAVAACGSFIADQIFFWIGRRHRDHRFVVRMKRRPAFARAVAAFERHPVAFTFAFRFLYGLRTVSPIAIGTTRLTTARFVTINAVAALAWAATFILLGYCFGHAFEASSATDSTKTSMTAEVGAIR